LGSESDFEFRLGSETCFESALEMEIQIGCEWGLASC
jgi:hypothetical protein